jgi:hypothetical protein
MSAMGDGKLKRISGCQMDCIKKLRESEDGALVVTCPYAAEEYERCHYEDAPEELLDIANAMRDILIGL